MSEPQPPRYPQERPAGMAGPDRPERAPDLLPPAAPSWPDIPSSYGTYPPAYPPAVAPRKRRRVFWWVFLAIQVIFLIWVVAGATVHTGPDAAQVAQLCGHGQWQGLFTSLRDCQVHGGHGLADAGNLGKGIGLALVVALWVVADVLVGGTYAIYRLASRPRG